MIDKSNTETRDRFKRLVSSIWPINISPRIIYYHSIHPTTPLSTTPSQFMAHMDWLSKQKYKVLTFKQLIESAKAKRLGERSVSVTFDDGYLDNFDYAFPILKERGLVATFFVASGFLGDMPNESDTSHHLYEGRRMMTSQQLGELHRAGMEIGSHTHSHVHAAELCRMNPGGFLDDVVLSKSALERASGSSVTSFAYPLGQRLTYNDQTREIIMRAGYERAATTVWGWLTPVFDDFEVPRIEISANDSVEVFARKVTGMYDFLRYYALISTRGRRWY